MVPSDNLPMSLFGRFRREAGPPDPGWTAPSIWPDVIYGRPGGLVRSNMPSSAATCVYRTVGAYLKRTLALELMRLDQLEMSFEG